MESMNARLITVTAPPSKSVSHRMLMGAALADGISEVSNALTSVDIVRTQAILSAAGAVFTPMGPTDLTGLTGQTGTAMGASTYRVLGVSGVLKGASAGVPLDCNVHESGTTCRLLTALLATGRGRFRLHGAERMHTRPVGQLTDVLIQLGAKVRFEGRPHCPPLVLDTDGLEGGEISIGVDESSQYLSGLLLAAPLCRKGLTLHIAGETVVSWPYIGLTLQCLEDFGLHVDTQTRPHGTAPWHSVPWRSLTDIVPGRVRFIVPPGRYRAGAYTVEGDWSGASYLLAAGAIGHRPVRVLGLRQSSLQGDRALLDILTRMGADIACTPEGICVSPAPLHGITVNMGACPDLVPTVAVLAAFATGKTTITGAAHLRIKESDRIAAPAAELRKAGVTVDEHDDGLTIYGMGQGGPRWSPATVFCTHGDHRMAMSLALLALRGQTPHLDAPDVVSKSFPHFWNIFKTIRDGQNS